MHEGRGDLQLDGAVQSVAYVPPPVICERLQSIIMREGGEWTRLSREEPVEYALPTHASQELREFFALTSSASASDLFLARLPGGRVFGAGAVLSADGRSIARDVSVDFGKPLSEHWLTGYKKIRPPKPLSGRVAVAATALGSGYAHWLLEELPRLLSLDTSDCDHVIAHGIPSFTRDALDRSGAAAKLLEPARYSHFQCEQLIVPGLIGEPGYPIPEVSRRLRKFTAGIGKSGSGLGERLYLSREKSRRRRVTNETELWDWLAARGFVKVHVEELSWAEQIAAFRDAKVIVAPHGAALANGVFCSGGTRIVEIFNRSYVNGCYWRLAAIQGLDYRPIVREGPPPLQHRLDCNVLDIIADISLIAAAISS